MYAFLIEKRYVYITSFRVWLKVESRVSYHQAPAYVYPTCGIQREVGRNLYYNKHSINKY